MENINPMSGAGKGESPEETLYNELGKQQYSSYPYEVEDLGEGMALMKEVICRYWKPRFLLNRNTKRAYEFMDSTTRLKTVTHDDIDWDSLESLPEAALATAQRLSFFYPSFIYGFENGTAEVCWQLRPDGMFYMDEDGFGMTDSKEINIYGFIDMEGRVVAKFRRVNDIAEKKLMRFMAEEEVKRR